jgi:predicted transcriptional regulator
MLVKSADPNKIGVQLGLLCIEKNIPAQEIAQHFNITRASVYAWFKGQSEPKAKHVESIKELLAKLRGPAV